jgi:hypothetical protein
MDCPNCKTYNPEERTTCWRCNTELPARAPVKRRDPQKSARIWLYVAVVALVLSTVVRLCGYKLPGSDPTGYAPLGAPAVAQSHVGSWCA